MAVFFFFPDLPFCPASKSVQLVQHGGFSCLNNNIKKNRNLFSGVLDCAQYGHQDRAGKQHTSSGAEGSAAPPSQMAYDYLPSWPLAGFLYVSFCLCSVSHDHLLYVQLVLLHLCTISLIELKDPAITACLLISSPR